MASGTVYEKRLLRMVEEMTIRVAKLESAVTVRTAMLEGQVGMIAQELGRNDPFFRILTDSSEKGRLTHEQIRQALAYAKKIGVTPNVEKVRDAFLHARDHPLSMTEVPEDNKRMDYIEAQVNTLRSAVQVEETDLDAVEGQLHHVVKRLAQNQDIMSKIIQFIASQQNFDLYQSVNDSLDLAYKAVGTAKKVGDGITAAGKASVEWVPLFGNFATATGDAINSVADEATGALDMALDLKESTTAQKIYKTVKLVQTIGGVINASMAIINKTVQVHDIPWTSGAAAELMMRGFAEARDEYENRQGTPQELIHPVFQYWVTPIQGLELSKNLGDWIIEQSPEWFKRWIMKKGWLPVHGYILLVFPISELEKKELRVEVGVTVKQAVDLLLSGDLFKSSFIHYEATHHKRLTVDDPWVVVGGKQIDGSALVEYRSVENESRLVRSDAVHLSWDLCVEFVKCLKESDLEPYSLLGHNCQQVSDDIVDFVHRGKLPHWWGTDCSIHIMEAYADELYNQPTVNGESVTPLVSHTVNRLSLAANANDNPDGVGAEHPFASDSPANGENALTMAQTLMDTHKETFLQKLHEGPESAIEVWKEEGRNFLHHIL